MLKVGLTGGIGSGKSTVAAIFSSWGVPVFDADAAARQLMNQDQALQQAIVGLFGEAIFSQGVLNRKALAAIVFNDPLRLEQLNALVHPATLAAAENWMAAQQYPYVVKEAALLFEAGTAGNLDYLIGVQAPKALRIQRAMARDGATRQDILSRMSRQIDDDIKMRLCDAVIVNDEQQLLIPQVVALHEQLLLLAKSAI